MVAAVVSPLDAVAALVVDDDPRADEADAGEHALGHAASGIRGGRLQLLDHRDRQRRGQGGEGVGAQPGGAVVQLAVEADQTAEQGGAEQVEQQRQLGQCAVGDERHGQLSTGACRCF
nr:hypothetical protein [Pseudomonas citronellolis]